MKERDAVVVAVILALLFWPRRTVTENLFEICVFPDGTETQVPLGASCPYDSSHGGQSAIVPIQEVFSN